MGSSSAKGSRTTAQSFIEAAESESGIAGEKLEAQWQDHISKHPEAKAWDDRILSAAQKGGADQEALEKEYLVWRSQMYLEWLRLMGIDLPKGNPERARHEHITDTKDPTLLGEKLVPQGEDKKTG